MNPVEFRRKKLRIRAELFDKLQFLFQEYNDHQIRAVIRFEGAADRVLLEKAVLRSVELVPILGCRFVPDKARPYWEQADGSDGAKLFSFADIGDAAPEAEIQRFVTGKTDERTGPQIMTRVIRASGKDTLCIVINHMVCDGAGFKEYLYLLGKIYTSLQEGTSGDFPYHNGSRSERQIYRNFTISEKLRSFALFNKFTKEKNAVRFPLSSGQAGQTPFILTHRLSADRFEKLKKYGKAHAVTINDIVLAAYFRALNRMLGKEQRDSLTIPCMVDLRRYLPGKKADGICNLASMIACHIGATDAESFDETVLKVNAVMRAEKSAYPGLSGLSTLKILYKLPFSKTYRLLKKHYPNPMIGITNIGVIDSGRLIFGKVPIKDACVAASIKHPPYFQLGFTTYTGVITFTVNQYGSEKDKETIRRFFSLLDQELSLKS